MHKRNTLHGSAGRAGASARSASSIPPAESSTRIRGAARSTSGVEDSIHASIEFAIEELDSLELPFAAVAPPLVEPPQRMPRGMPPLPFQAPHPRNMPPLPLVPSLSAPANDAMASPDDSKTSDLAPRPSRGWLFVALLMGVVCLGGALWLQLH
jgi:hypothetical protein